MSDAPFAAWAEPAPFVLDQRFAPLPPSAEAEPGDPLAEAWHEGYAAGRAEAEDEAAARAEADAAARGRIELALARLDAEQAEVLRARLLAAVEALCSAAIAPLALDVDALTVRIERAAAMLARADDERVLRLHPADLALIGPRLPAGLAVQGDPALERGSLRIETAAGGVEDGPEHWRRAIAEALAQC